MSDPILYVLQALEATVVDSLVAYAGGGQSNATALTWGAMNRIVTVASVGDSCKFNTVGLAPAKILYVRNDGANQCSVYPPTGGQIDSLGLNTSCTLNPGFLRVFVAATTTQFYTLHYAELPTYATTYLSLPFSSGTSLLSQSITLEGTPVAPMFIYEGRNASAGGWTATAGGQNLALGSTGTVPSFNIVSPLTNATDLACKSEGGQIFQTAGNVFNITTEDYVFEFIGYNMYTDGTRRLVSHYLGGIGYEFVLDGGSYLQIRDGVNTVAVSAGVDQRYTWGHHLVVCNQGANGGYFLNGKLQNTLNISTVGSLSVASKLVIGSSANFGLKSFSSVLWCAMWSASGWLSTHNQATFAAQRSEQFQGLYPDIALGTTVYPTTRSRGTLSAVYIDMKVPSLFGISQNMFHPSTEGTVRGLALEGTTKNLVLQSENFGTTWSKVNGTDTITLDATTSPRNDSLADALIADATSTVHGVSQAVTLTAAPHTFSVYAKPGNQNWLYLSDTTVANAHAYFDISTGTYGTIGAAATAYMEPAGYGFYRCSITYTGTVASHTHRALTATADGVATFAGNGSTVNTYIFGAQIQQSSFATAYMGTTTAALPTSPEAGELIYSLADGNMPAVGTGKMGVYCSFLQRANVIGTTYLWSINDDTANNYLTAELQSSGFIQIRARSAAGSVQTTTGAVSYRDGVAHTLAVLFDASKIYIIVDGVLIKSAGCTYPVALTQLQFQESEVDTTSGYLVLGSFLIKG